VALPYTFQSILRQKKKNYGNSNIYFTMQKYNLQKNPLKDNKYSFEIGLALEASQKMKEPSIIDYTHSFIMQVQSSLKCNSEER